jgi:hypothetical protein
MNCIYKCFEGKFYFHLQGKVRIASIYYKCFEGKFCFHLQGKVRIDLYIINVSKVNFAPIFREKYELHLYFKCFEGF